MEKGDEVIHAIRIPAERKGRNRLSHVEFLAESGISSSNFLRHGHDLAKCDVIVCWEHDWTGCPKEVVSLKDMVSRVRSGGPGTALGTYSLS